MVKYAFAVLHELKIRINAVFCCCLLKKGKDLAKQGGLKANFSGQPVISSLLKSSSEKQ